MNLSFYGSHNAAFTLADDKEIIEVLEVERFLNMKNMGIAQYKTNQDIFLFDFGTIPEHFWIIPGTFQSFSGDFPDNL